MKVKDFIEWYCHDEAVVRARKKLAHCWNDDLMDAGNDFCVSEFLGFDILSDELGREVDGMLSSLEGGGGAPG